MERIYLDFDMDVPRYICTVCKHCTSTMGISFGRIKDRGCCYYYPKFELIHIQRMSKTKEGLKTLNMIIDYPGTVIYRYYIHVKGFFDHKTYKENYNKALEIMADKGIEDDTMFFRACAFVESGYGCKLPPRYRSSVCNLFICSDIEDHSTIAEDFKPYERERERYIRWEKWENEGLAHILAKQGCDLLSDFHRSIEILQDIPLDIYEFKKLDEILIDK